VKPAQPNFRKPGAKERREAEEAVSRAKKDKAAGEQKLSLLAKRKAETELAMLHQRNRKEAATLAAGNLHGEVDIRRFPPGAEVHTGDRNTQAMPGLPAVNEGVTMTLDLDKAESGRQPSNLKEFLQDPLGYERSGATFHNYSLDPDDPRHFVISVRSACKAILELAGDLHVGAPVQRADQLFLTERGRKGSLTLLFLLAEDTRPLTVREGGILDLRLHPEVDWTVFNHLMMITGNRFVSFEPRYYNYAQGMWAKTISMRHDDAYDEHLRLTKVALERVWSPEQANRDATKVLRVWIVHFLQNKATSLNRAAKVKMFTPNNATNVVFTVPQEVTDVHGFRRALLEAVNKGPMTPLVDLIGADGRKNIHFSASPKPFLVDAQ
jgi:hypothetical protein